MKRKLANEHILHPSPSKVDAETGKEIAKVWGSVISCYFDPMQVESPILKEELKKRMVPLRTYIESYDENGVYRGPSPTTAVAETSAQGSAREAEEGN